MSHKNKGREIIDYLNDINDSISDIQSFTADMSFEKFENDKKTQHAVIHCLEIIGEAVKKIPDDIRNKYPDMPWKEIAGMRDKLIHEYFGIDLESVWTTIIDDIHPLNNCIVQLIKEVQ